VPAGVPGEHGERGEVQFVDNVLETAGVFMSAVEESEGVWGRDRRRAGGR
jgi:hypothetical protein